MSCQPCTSRDYLPLCAIYSILNRLYCSLSSANRIKNRKYEDYRCAVRVLSRYSVDPRGGYAGFLGLRDNEPTKFAAIYIDNIRGEYDPNLGVHRVYHVAYVNYGDTNGVTRTLRQRAMVIAGNAAEISGESPIEKSISQKVYRSQGGILPNGTVPMPMGITMPFAGNPPSLVPGTPEDINQGNEIAVGGYS